MRFLRRRKSRRAAPISEAEAYARCHELRATEVRIVRVEERRPRYRVRLSGEELRRRFEERLDARADGLLESGGAVDGNGAPLGDRPDRA